MPRRTRNTGFWGRVEAFVLELQEDPEKSARVLQAVWYLSLAFILFGFAVIAYVAFFDGSWPPRL